MASSDQIPNLKTLLGPRRGGGLRGRGRGGGAFGSSNEEREQLRDNAVKGTDQDAAGARVSCVELGYLHDPYAKWFATQPATRRLPLLNRGSYVRTAAIDLLVTRFILADRSAPKQIISLGAGTDTRYFRLRDLYPDVHLTYHEIDFSSNTAAKIASIEKHQRLYEKLQQKPSSANSSYHSNSYNVHALDLRTLKSSGQESPLPSIPNIDPSTPTLILSEMCLVYLEPPTVKSIMASLLQHYLQPTTPASLILYEPILPGDAFGRTMISNLQSRNIVLSTLTAYPELGDQRARLKSYGLDAGAKAADTNHIWRNWVDENEKERVGRLEFLDEVEELELLLQHYCIAWGWRDGKSDVFSKAWADVPEQGGG